MTRSTVLKKSVECDLSIESLKRAIDLSKSIEQKTGYRVTFNELLYECGEVEQAVSNSRVLQEFIYRNPQPNMTRLRRVDDLIDKGANR